MTSKLFEYYKEYTKDEIQQGTPEWFKVRELKLTASKADCIATNGKGLETYVKELLADYFSSSQYEEYTGKYKSPAMQRGNDFEAMARMVYEFETGNTVREVGFIERSKYIGCSPDGLVTEDGSSEEDGLIEIKNHDDKVFLELILTEKVDPKYVKQMQYQMWTTGKKFCDYFGFNPNFKPNFYKERFLPDQELFKKFEAGVFDGIEMLENSLNKVSKVLFKQEKCIENNDEVKEEKETKLEEKIEVKKEKKTDDFPF